LVPRWPIDTEIEELFLRSGAIPILVHYQARSKWAALLFSPIVNKQWEWVEIVKPPIVLRGNW